MTTVAVTPDRSAPVVSLLPPERRPSTLRPDVTVHHLLTHTSGIADYADAVGRHVFEPAGMAASGFFRLDELPPDVAVGYLPSGRSTVYSIPVVGGADGGSFSSAPDLDRFLRWYDGSPWAAELFRPHAEVQPGLGMGLGVFLYGGGRFGHGGGDPGYEALVQRIPSRDTTVVALCNVEGRVADVRDRLVDAVLSEG